MLRHRNSPMRPNDPGCLLLHTTTPFLLKSPTHRPRKMERNQTSPRGRLQPDNQRSIKALHQILTGYNANPKADKKKPKEPQTPRARKQANQTIRSTTFRTNRLQHNRRISRKPRCTPEQTSKSKRLDNNQNLVKQ